MENVLLFCFPYAGASSSVYKRWQNHLDASITLTPVELAGRGSRLDEGMYSMFDDLVEDAYSCLEQSVKHYKYALFGHSMGALIVFELYHKLKERKKSLPKHLFFSGQVAPHMLNRHKDTWRSDGQLIQSLQRLGGTPKEFFQHKELIDLYLPIIKNDYRLLDSYKPTNKKLLDEKITILYGDNDDVTKGNITKWDAYSNKTCKYIGFEGGHFFIHDYEKEVVEEINHTLARDKINNL